MFLTSYQRQELGTRRPKQTAFPRTGPGGGREEEKRRGNPLPASPGEGCPPPSVPTPHAPGREPGCPCSALPQRGCGGGGDGGRTATAVPVGTDRPGGHRALRDGDSPGDTAQGVHYRPRAVAAKPSCCSGSPTEAANQNGTPARHSSHPPGRQQPPGRL